MIKESFARDVRALKTVNLEPDLVVVGGGLSGVCAAISAARLGVKVVLVQDRPVLGGNASSEVRLWVLGATSHMGNNNRWSREGGIINEMLIENTYKNKEGNPVIFDTILLDFVKREPNITLLLNTMVYDLEKSSENHIERVMGFCSQNYTFYDIKSKLFCDASGDGVVAYKAGVSYRMGAEDKLEFGEKFAPDRGDYGELLGHSLYFYSKDVGKPVKYTAPSFALKDITKIPRFNNINSDQHGCKFWWLEYGGRLDTIHDTEEIKWELWSVVYGVWDYIKNSGKFPDSENLTLEWVGLIPGKRESRRFLGYYTMVQDDIVLQRHFDDAIAFGGWAIDLHPADGVYSETSGCIQYHSKGIYEIPYRSFVSLEIDNLFFAGRCISTSHVAHGSTRVMATSAFGGQAVGVAVAQCLKKNLAPADLIALSEMQELQQTLNIKGQSIPHTFIHQETNLASKATIAPSSTLSLNQISSGNLWYDLCFSAAQMLPLNADTAYTFEVEVEAKTETKLVVELRCAEKARNYTPDLVVEQQTIDLKTGRQRLTVQFSKGLPQQQYGFVTFMKNDDVKIRMSDQRFTGILSVFNKFNLDVNNNGKQTPPADSGIDAFEFWCPDRRPNGQNLAITISPALEAYTVDNIVNGYTRPSSQSNAWVANLEDKCPKLSLFWEETQTVHEIILYFDSDFDHALESVQMGHPENVMPFCVREYKIVDSNGNIIFETKDNYQTINKIPIDKPLETTSLVVEMKHPSTSIPASLFQIVIR